MRQVLSEEVVLYQRNVYNILDLIGDIGGLLDGLTYLVRILLYLTGFIFGNPLMSYLVDKVFLTTLTIDRTKTDKWNRLQTKKNHFKSAQEVIEKSLDITSFLVKQRMMWNFVKSSYSKPERKAIR